MMRRTAAILATTGVLALGFLPSASAQAPELGGYAAGATGTALQLTLAGQTLAVSQTSAALDSTPKSAADGAALLLAGTPVPGAAPSTAPEGPATNEQCPLEADLAEITQGALSLLELEVACLTTAASLDGGPSAQASSGEAVIRITSPAGAVLGTILGPVLEGVETVTDPIIEALTPLLGPISDTTGIDVADILGDLTGALGDETFVLVEIVVAPSVSRVSATAADGVLAEAGSNGVTIRLLPGVEATLAELTELVEIPDPAEQLLEITLGSAKAQVVRDPVTGAPAPDASAAQILAIEAGDNLGILGDVTDQLTGALDQLAAAGAPLSCEGGALADVLCIDLGSVNELDAAELEARNMAYGEGTVGREASAASVQVLSVLSEQLGGSALGLSLASATAAANAPAPVAPPAQPAPAAPTPQSLPRTGTDAQLPVALGLLAVAGIGVAALRRTRTV